MSVFGRSFDETVVVRAAGAEVIGRAHHRPAAGRQQFHRRRPVNPTGQPAGWS